MTEAEARIEQLKTQPPHIERTVWEKCERAIGWATAIVAVIALLIGLNNVSALAAESQHTLALATCINKNLAGRQKPQQAQRQAELNWATVILAAFTPKPGESKRAEVAALETATKQYVTALGAAIHEAKERPLGKC